jgi:hypothetical protein
MTPEETKIIAEAVNEAAPYIVLTIALIGAILIK